MKNTIRLKNVIYWLIFMVIPFNAVCQTKMELSDDKNLNVYLINSEHFECDKENVFEIILNNTKYDIINVGAKYAKVKMNNFSRNSYSIISNCNNTPILIVKARNAETQKMETLFTLDLTEINKVKHK